MVNKQYFGLSLYQASQTISTPPMEIQLPDLKF